MTAPDRLYGLPGAERLHDDIASVYELELDGMFDDGHDERNGPWVVEEWTVQDSLHQVPLACDIIERLAEQFSENGMYEDDPLPNIHLDPEALALAEALRVYVAKKANFHWADKKVGEHAITMVDDEPYLNGEPLYHSAGETRTPKYAFKMSIIDRLTITGRGVVATGEVLEGTVAAGDLLDMDGRQVLCTGVETFNRPPQTGDRCGVLLRDVALDEIPIGKFLTREAS